MPGYEFFDAFFAEQLPLNLRPVYDARSRRKCGAYQTAEELSVSVSFVRWAEDRIFERWKLWTCRESFKPWSRAAATVAQRLVTNLTSPFEAPRPLD